MSKTPKRVVLKPDTDLRELIEAVHEDKEPRLLERDGEALAVIVSPEEYVANNQIPKSRKNKEAILALAGSWKDLDAEALIDYVYKARHDSPPSPPASL